MRSSDAIRIGFVPLARTTFDVPLARELAAQAFTWLQAAGIRLPGAEEGGPPPLVTTPDEAERVARELDATSLDLLVVLQATFADSTMVSRLVGLVDAPLLLWALPEERTGGRLRLNSFCGVNLAAHALRRAGHPFDYVYGSPFDPAVLDKIRVLALAGRARRLLRRARIGRIGRNPDGLDSCIIDEEALAGKLGVEVVPLSLGDLFAAARAAPPDRVELLLQRLSGPLDGLAALEPVPLRRTLSSYLALRELAQRERLDGLAVRCWPEFFTELGCAACGAMSLLSDEGVPCACEADGNSAVTQLILQALSGEPAFGTDLVGFDLEEGTAVLWHCGLAPLSMADPSVRPRGTVHSNRGLPLLMEFPLKPGRVTLARLSEATGSYRLVVGGGEMVQAPLSFAGTSGVVRFDRPAREVLDTLLTEGLEHHIALTYGDHVPSLLALARMLDLPILRLC